MANQSNVFSVDSRVDTATNLSVGSLHIAGSSNVGGLAYRSETLTGNAAAVVADPTIPISFVDSTAQFINDITLADGTSLGQQKQFIYTVVGFTTDITPANTCGAYTSIRFTTGGATVIGQCVTLVWTPVGWAVVSRASGDAGTNATTVAGYPDLV